MKGKEKKRGEEGEQERERERKGEQGRVRERKGEQGRVKEGADFSHYRKLYGENPFVTGCHGQPDEWVNADKLHLYIICHEWFP